MEASWMRIRGHTVSGIAVLEAQVEVDVDL